MKSWSDLRIFLAVCRTPSLRQAGREQGLDVSTVSRRLAALEDDLGTPLFDRRGRTWAPTTAGDRLRTVVERFERELERVERELTGADGSRRTVVRLTYPDILADLIGSALPLLTAVHPEIELEIIPGDRPVDMDRGEADVCIRVQETPGEVLFGRRVAKLAGALYAAESYLSANPAAVSDPRHAWVDWSPRYMGKPALAWIETLFPDRRVVVRADSGHAVLQAVRSGLGIGAVACWIGDRDPTLRRLHDAPSTASASIWVLTHASLRSDPTIRSVMALLSDALTDHRRALEGQEAEA